MKSNYVANRVQSEFIRLQYLSIQKKIVTYFSLFFLLLIFSIPAQSQSNSPLSFSQIPFSNVDFIAPFRGSEQWNAKQTWDNVNKIQAPAGALRGLDIYMRFTWMQIEPGARGVYSWDFLDGYFRYAIDYKMNLNLAIMPLVIGYGTNYDGGTMSYPTSLHNSMQSEASNSRDWMYDGNWIPNWNSPNYLERWEELLRAVANHINTTSYNGVLFKDALGYVDIRGYGNFGEWHTSPFTDRTPAGRSATISTLKRLVDAEKTAFPNNPLMVSIDAFQEGYSSNVPAEVAHYILTTSNNWGRIGWRRDNLGSPIYSDFLENNPARYNGISISSLIMNQWRYAPIGGEPWNGTDYTSDFGRQTIHYDSENQVRRYHMSMFGNGNFPDLSAQSTKNNLLAAYKACGYRIVLEGGSLSSTIRAGQSFQVVLNWKNVGIAPVYQNWNVTFELQNQSNNTIAWTGNSSHNLKLWLPQTNATIVTDNFSLPSNIPAGTYRLVLKIKDPTNYRDPLPLALQGRRTDGSYLIKSDISITSGGSGNSNPTANAGNDQSITLPSNSANLSGNGTDTDGTISSFNWTKVSGPSGDLIQSATAAATLITGLVAGIYVYRLSVSDNNGATASDEVQITVNNPSPPPNSPPFVNAGNDQTITLPANTTTLNGSATDSDGSLASYAWSKVSGPAGSTIQSPAVASTNIAGLTAGTFVFRLTVTDNSGATATDDVQVIVNASPAPAPANQAPVANAGNDINISLPTNSASLSGSGNDPDGTIASFVWTKISGPAGGNIQSANAASTNITGLTAGTYVFRLTVTDNSGATATDDVQIVVSSQPPTANPAPVANAGADKTITLPANATTLNGSGTDANGTISSYRWTKVSGPAGGNLQSPNGANTNVRGLNAGTYIFRLTVTDNGGLTGTDDVQVLVNTSLAPSPTNQAPVANAGNDITVTLPVNRASLSGTASDPDGSVSTYNWSKVSGPTGGNIQSPAISNTDITGLAAGTYVFRLTVTDNAGAQSTDDIQITVNQAAPSPTGNQAPTANAGLNQNISVPVNSVALTGSGSDVDGSIASYSWVKVSGPSAGTIQSPNAASTTISGLVEGTYAFRLTVTDNAGATATDDVQVIVSPTPVATNQLPTANAGKDISITLPVNSVVLNGAASVDPDGNIVGYNWTKIQGPIGSSITNNGTATPTIIGLARGTHEFEVTVTDNRGGTATDRVIVNVLKINQKPVALSARDTINVSLPVQNAELNATNSYDPDGTITNYQWTFKNGPKKPKMLAPQASKTIITDLVAGTYEYDLEVTDDDGEKAVKSLVVIVKNSSNRRLIPIVSAYPNPATDIVNVKIDSEVEGRTTLTFIDMNGRPAMTDIFVKGSNSFIRQVNIARLPKGTYAILVQVDQTEKVVEKIVKF